MLWTDWPHLAAMSAPSRHWNDAAGPGRTEIVTAFAALREKYQETRWTKALY